MCDWFNRVSVEVHDWIFTFSVTFSDETTTRSYNSIHITRFLGRRYRQQISQCLGKRSSYLLPSRFEVSLYRPLLPLSSAPRWEEQKRKWWRSQWCWKGSMLSQIKHAQCDVTHVDQLEDAKWDDQVTLWSLVSTCVVVLMYLFGSFHHKIEKAIATPNDGVSWGFRISSRGPLSIIEEQCAPTKNVRADPTIYCSALRSFN